MSDWYYSKAGRQAGPMDRAALAHLVFTGEVAGEDSVWRTGMAAWQPAGVTTELFDAASRPPVLPQEAVTANPIGYYTAAGEMPPRAARLLKKYAPPLGDTGHWPLSDRDVAEFVQAERHRKRIRITTQTFRALFGLSLIGTLLIMLVLVFGVGVLTGRKSAMTPPEMIGLGVAVAISLATTLLYGFAALLTPRGRVWPAYTVAALMVLSSLSTIGQAALVSVNGTAAAISPAILGAIVTTLIAAAIAYSALRGALAIPKFRRSPAWAQEALVAAKL